MKDISKSLADITNKINELVEYNHISDANMIYPNQEITMI